METPRKPARPRDRSWALYVLLEPEMLAAVDAWVGHLNTGNTGPQWTRTTLVRAMISRALSERAQKGEVP